MSAMVKLDVSGIIYGSVTTLMDSCIKSVVNNFEKNVDNVGSLPANLKDKCIYLMSKRGFLTDSNIGKILHDKVKVLDLADCEISDVGLSAICKCPQLRKIDLNSNKQSRTNITSEGICNLARSCRHLQTVYLRRCINITDVAVETLSRSCPQLRLLNIGGCQNISDSSLRVLGENSKFLKSINISNTLVSDAGIMQLVSGQCAAALTEMHINGCKNVTDEAVEAIMQFCPQINILIFHGCPNITEQSRQALEDLTVSRSAPMKQVTWTIY
ncbi:protein AMN1 homolog isoform X1 [Ruditapes philippinarum]|uniref:protein AMN1 homolog isoform X1 n=1 Tax=Ruditapes philippinarum TaxID=129788 RepID=UPI00295B5075|nr:protein AMN1 homolog isoform X1 [Ruditapes philippinarum]